MKEETIKAFCIKLALFTVLLVVIDQGVGLAFVKIKNIGLAKNPESMWVKTPFVVEKVESDVLIIGSSKAMHHYDPKILSDSLKMSVYNCGQDGCFFLYQNTIINMLLDRYKPKMIIWDIQPECFTDCSSPTEYQNMRYLSPYYSNNIWVKKYVNSQGFKTAKNMNCKMYSYNSKAIQYVFPLLVKGVQTDRGYVPLMSQRNRNLIFSKLKNDTVSYKKPLTWLNLLSNTETRCQKMGVKLYLFSSPEYTRKKISYKIGISDIKRISKCNNVNYVDYSSNKQFISLPELFEDASHLNIDGAGVYTKLIISDLK